MPPALPSGVTDNWYPSVSSPVPSMLLYAFYIKMPSIFFIVLFAGEFGKYQMRQFLLHILAALTAGLHMLTFVTVAAVPSHR